MKKQQQQIRYLADKTFSLHIRMLASKSNATKNTKGVGHRKAQKMISNP